MHLQGVPVAVIAAWIGHKDASLTMRLYAHGQFAALQDAFCDIEFQGRVRRAEFPQFRGIPPM
jgi:hypothetical protein